MLEALQQRRAEHDVLVATGLLLHSLQRYDEALDCTARVLADDPDNSQALLLSAQVHHDLGDAATGNAAIDAALERHPDDRRLRLSYARLLARSDLADRAPVPHTARTGSGDTRGTPRAGAGLP